MNEGIAKDNLLIFLDWTGYGLSDDTKQDMTVETVVENYRAALQNAGIEARICLWGGGIYATYRESKYPNEIEAVIRKTDLS